MINKILSDIEELKNNVDNMQTVLLSLNSRLNELEFRAGLFTPEEDQEIAEARAVEEALENPPEDNIEEGIEDDK